MSILDTLRKNLTPEDLSKITDALGDDFDFDMVPRSRLNKVISQRNVLRKQIADGSQHQDDDDTDDDDKAGGDVVPVSKKTGVDEKGLRKAFDIEKANAVQEIKIQYAALDKLRTAGAIDADLLWNGGLIDKSTLKVDTAGAITGLDEAITALKTGKAHLFTSKKADDVPAGTGKEGEDAFKGVTNRTEFLKLDGGKQIAFKQANPEMFKRFTAE